MEGLAPASCCGFYDSIDRNKSGGRSLEWPDPFASRVIVWRKGHALMSGNIRETFIALKKSFVIFLLYFFIFIFEVTPRKK
jgi:hypothetical protein